jgi:hypothetical protein
MCLEPRCLEPWLKAATIFRAECFRRNTAPLVLCLLFFTWRKLDRAARARICWKQTVSTSMDALQARGAQ